MTNPDRFPIVGIGASAGGLAAFEAFFSGMPAGHEPGMAFVLVQHLAPDHKSVLTELVGRYTEMEVFEVEDGMKVQPNAAYIIPPNHDMALLNGTLHLMDPSAPRGRRMPIDFFFQSLAQDQGDRAICIVLSGTGTDGTQGARAVKAEGGMVMVQSPATTEYDGMPRSALATNLVDYQLGPAEMPAQLMAYVNHAFRKPPMPGAPSEDDDRSLGKLFVLLRARTGHDFSQYKPSTVHRRVERRMAVHQIDGINAYLQFAQQAPAELDALFRDLLIGVTSFFRDPEAFVALEQEVIPRILAGKQAADVVRVWVPGCSTGEEAYSIAILIREHADRLNLGCRVQIFATDIDQQAIATARAGVYPPLVATVISPKRLARFFVPEPAGAGYRVQKSIRDTVVFSEQDVAAEPPFSRVDLVSCRNVMIYMSGELQRRLVNLFHYALNHGGFLFLGSSETVGEARDLFLTVERKWKIYQRAVDAVGARRTGLGRVVPSPALAEQTRLATAKPAAKRRPLREVTEHAILEEASIAGALVDRRGDILYLHGRTGLFLEPAPGEVSVDNILKMAREGLRLEATTALRKAVTEHIAVRRPGLRVRTNGGFSTVNLVVKPALPAVSASDEAAAASQEPLYLVVMEAVPALSSDDAHPPPTAPSASRDDDMTANARIAALKDELRAKEEFLETTNEELATTNDELTSSNEELQSVNEELQSTNEELETSKEELQSINEELATINAELQAKVSDLSRVNNDMNNLLAGTGIATVFVDRELRLVRFTPAASQIIHLIATDVGRPVGHIASNLVGYDLLTADTRSVLETLVPKEIDVQTGAGAFYTMRILPYRTLENVIEGAVITFVDVTAAKQAQAERRLADEAMRLNAERMRVALRASPIAVFNQDEALRYTWIYAVEDQIAPSAVVGKTDAEILPADEAAVVEAIKNQVLMSGVGARREVRMTFGRGPRLYDLMVEPLRDPSGRVVGVTCASLDISDRGGTRAPPHEPSRASGREGP